MTKKQISNSASEDIATTTTNNNDTNTADETMTAHATDGQKNTTNMKSPAAGTNKREREESTIEKASAVPMPITVEGDMPQKKFYRSRAHCNPLSHNDTFSYCAHPDSMDWRTEHYPFSDEGVAPDVLDVGCGFGGLTIALATLLPNHNILGLEIRAKVTEYVRLRIAALRKEHATTNDYRNCSVLRSNTMKFMPHLFKKRSIAKLFFCFPDPHFKKKNHPRRIVSERLLTEYAYFLKPGTGRLYCITDVEDLHNWHVEHCRAHPLFRELSEKEMEQDPCVAAMQVETEEGKKVARAGAAKYHAVYERVPDDDAALAGVVNENDFWNVGAFGVMDTKRLRDETTQENGAQ